MGAAPAKRLSLLIGVVVIAGGWMTFDGIHALVTGDFVTPKSGRFEGQLGPWAPIPRALDIDPRSNEIKALSVILGLTYLASLAAVSPNRHCHQRCCAIGVGHSPTALREGPATV